MSRRMLDYTDLERLENQLKTIQEQIELIKEVLREANLLESESEE